MHPAELRPGKLLITFLILLSSSSYFTATFADQQGNSFSSGDDEINHAMNDFHQAWDQEDFTTAVTGAQRLVGLIEQSRYRQSKYHVAALHNLANAQQALGWFRKSEKNYKLSIEIIERNQGSYAADLPVVLNSLGALYYDSADFDLAKDMFSRAQHISHRTDGVYTLKQLNSVDWITRTNLKTSRSRDADRQQRFYYIVNVQNYGEDDPRMLPIMQKMADWFRRTGQFKSAVKLYKKALAVITKNDLGENEKLKPLRGISSVAYLEDKCCGEKPLGEVLQIITRDPASDHADELDALVHLADMHMIRKKRGKAEHYYQRAWDRMGSENPLVSEVFGSPELLGVGRLEDIYNAYYQTVEGRRPQSNVIVYRLPRDESTISLASSVPKAPPASIIGEPLSLCHSRALELAHADDLEEYFVDVRFSVNSSGRVSNVSLVDSNAPKRLQRYVTNTLRFSRYRPTLVDGKVVDTDNIKLRQTFLKDHAMGNLNRISADVREKVALGCQLLAMAS